MDSTVFKSGFSSAFSALIYFILAFFLDKKINHKPSNLIALFITSILNFTFQSNIFFLLLLLMTFQIATATSIGGNTIPRDTINPSPLSISII